MTTLNAESYFGGTLELTLSERAEAAIAALDPAEQEGGRELIRALMRRFASCAEAILISGDSGPELGLDLGRHLDEFVADATEELSMRQVVGLAILFLGQD